MKKLAAKKRQAYLALRSSKTEKKRRKYISIRNKHSRIDQIKRKYWERFSRSIDQDMYGGQRKICLKQKKPVNK